jgi:hypothetical protein
MSKDIASRAAARYFAGSLVFKWREKNRNIASLASGPLGSVKEPAASPPAQA